MTQILISQVGGLSAALANIVPTTIAINTSTGLTGGGDLSTTRTISVTGNLLSLVNTTGFGILSITANNVINTRTLQSSNRLVITNANAANGNPNFDLNASGVASGTYTQVSVDIYGRVINANSPTTLAGYGITDAFSTQGGTIVGNLQIGSNNTSPIIFSIPFGAANAPSLNFINSSNSGLFFNPVSGPSITLNNIPILDVTNTNSVRIGPIQDARRLIIQAGVGTGNLVDGASITLGGAWNSTTGINATTASSVAGINGLVSMAMNIAVAKPKFAFMQISGTSATGVQSNVVPNSIMELWGPNSSASNLTIANYFTINAAVAGTSPSIKVAGTDTNIGLNFTTKGTGTFSVTAASTTISGSLSVNTSYTLLGGGSIYGCIVENALTSTLPVYNNVLDYDSSTNQTGTIKINLPFGWTGTNLLIRVFITDLSTGAGGTATVNISGINTLGGAWTNTAAFVDNTFNSNSVRLGYDSIANRCCILLGTTSTNWLQPKLIVKQVFVATNHTTGWQTGWSSTFLTNESTITNIQTITINSTISGGSSGSSNASLLNSEPGTYYLNWSNFTNTPTTIAGYGITDAFSTISGATISGPMIFTNSILIDNTTTPNMLTFATTPIGPPTFTTRSNGTRLLFSGVLSGNSTDYAIGVENSGLWFNVPSQSLNFNWYAGVTLWGQLSSTGLALTNGLTATSVTIGNILDTNIPSVVCGNTNTAIANYSISAYRTSELLIQASQTSGGTAGSYTSIKLLINHDGTNVNLTAYGLLVAPSTGSSIVNFAATLGGGTLTIFAKAITGTITVQGKISLIAA